MSQIQTDYISSFLDSVYVISHSTKSVKTYKTSLNHLKKFVESKYQTDIPIIIQKLKTEELDVYDLLRDFVIYLDKLDIRPKGLRAYLSGVKGFLRYSKIKINSDDFKYQVKVPKLVKTREVPITKSMIIRVLRNCPSKLQTAILVACSSGLRVGELIQLKLSDIDFETKPTKITVRSNTSKTRQSRETFITTEAANTLKDYLSRYFGWKENSDNSHLNEKYIFGPLSNKGRKSTKPGYNVDSAKLSLQMTLRTHVSSIPDLDVNNENGYKAIHFHGFRKFFRTTVGNVCGRDFSEALMGHGFYMDVYYQLSEEKKRELYLKTEPHLTISDYEKVEQDITSLTVKCNELEQTVVGLRQYIQNHSLEPTENLFSNTGIQSDL